MSQSKASNLAPRFGGGKGERGRARSPSGTNNPYKHYKQHPTDPNKVIYTDANGEKIEKPKPADFDKQRGSVDQETVEWLIPWWAWSKV